MGGQNLTATGTGGLSRQASGDGRCSPTLKAIDSGLALTQFLLSSAGEIQLEGRLQVGYDCEDSLPEPVKWSMDGYGSQQPEARR
jgi:hypothetical protein